MVDLAARLVAAIGSRRSAKDMAEASYSCLKQVALELEFSELEVVFRRPGEVRWFEDESSYCIAFEAGPSGWGYKASAAIRGATGKPVSNKHSFDLIFDPAND